MNKIKFILDTVDSDDQDLFRKHYVEDVKYLLSLIYDLKNRLDTIKETSSNIDDFDTHKEYDPNFGDDKRCSCGHTYYRHYDSYDNMNPVGCKYCSCEEFKK